MPYGKDLNFNKGLRVETNKLDQSSINKIIGLRKCFICGKKIKVFKRNIGKGGLKCLDSNEGTLYFNSWLCGRCSKIVMKNNTLTSRDYKDNKLSLGGLK